MGEGDRMKFDERYPTAALWQDATDPDYTVFRATAKPELKCIHCGGLTCWVDYCFEAGLCSEKCSKAEWDEFAQAYNRSSDRDEKTD